MKNPWKNAAAKWKDHGPYTLDGEAKDIDAFNKGLHKPQFEIKHRIIPEPFIGNVSKAKIIILMLNPGLEVAPKLEPSNTEYYHSKFKNLKRDILKNIKEEKLAYPFFYLNPKHRLSSGFRYWSQRLKEFLNDAESYKKISKKIAVIQFFPYHSEKYRWNRKELLKSQEYNIQLVDNHKKGKIIIIGKGKKSWDPVLKKIGIEKSVITLKSSRNSAISKKNIIGDAGFKKIKKALS